MDKKVLQKNLHKFLVADVFNLITEDDIIRKRGDKFYQKDRELTEGEVSNLKKEAEIIKQTKLWKLLISELKYHAQYKGTIQSESEEDLIAVKQLVYLVQTIEKFIKNFE